MTSEEIELLAWQNHAVNQLVCLKQCFGLLASITCVGDDGRNIRVSRVKDLVDIGWCDEKFLCIDDNWANLTIIESNSNRWLALHHDAIAVYG